MFQASRFLVIVLLALGVAACSSTPQPPVDLPATYWASPTPKVAVVPAELPKPTTVFMGSIGMLDLAIISVANSSLTSHLESLDVSEFSEIYASTEATLKEKGFSVVRVEKPFNAANAPTYKTEAGAKMVDLSQFRTSEGADHALFISLDTVGTTRPYYGPVPTSEPSVQVIATGRLIDLSSKKVLWYQQSTRTVAIPTPWDEADLHFPNITSTIYKELDTAKQQLLNSFVKAAGPVASQSGVNPVQSALNDMP